MFNWLSGILLIAGILLLAASTRSAGLPLFNLGMMALGAGVVVMGLEAITSGQISMRRGRHSRVRTTYIGLSARLYGVLFVLMGVIIAGIGVLRQLHLDNAVTALLASLLRTPQGISLAAILVGSTLILIGLINLADVVHQAASGRGSIMDLPARFIGTIAQRAKTQTRLL
ncbi:MAG TPA: hypothetical protein VFD70_06030 [Anaerolineae bacterium]|nr:hypothetical protein [Anaerolineae bacterium]